MLAIPPPPAPRPRSSIAASLGCPQWEPLSGPGPYIWRTLASCEAATEAGKRAAKLEDGLLVLQMWRSLSSSILVGPSSSTDEEWQEVRWTAGAAQRRAEEERRVPAARARGVEDDCRAPAVAGP